MASWIYNGFESCSSSDLRAFSTLWYVWVYTCGCGSMLESFDNHFRDSGYLGNIIVWV